ncbi:MAG: hypothetical protein ABIJ20_00685 [Nanoarchaeota archaeon]|nr:hypothetical protein [Nanoarchaeota archaeon]MBU1445166.1 hypothetical protein [Nanoarchaeota archaeon]MBU2420883.1 hypothetical protein [Nanoarchaeota archaeon]MBU2475354.1 hypothetical protein [Nanoarchaeota archaeon]
MENRPKYCDGDGDIINNCQYCGCSSSNLVCGSGGGCFLPRRKLFVKDFLEFSPNNNVSFLIPFGVLLILAGLVYFYDKKKR